MRIKHALTALAVGLFGMLGNAWAATDAEASAKCLKCHEEQMEVMKKTAHAVTADPRTPACTSCHGGSAQHLANPMKNRPDRAFKGKFAVTSAEASGVCLTCHQRDSKQALWDGSAHPGADVACSSCHKIHTDHDRVRVKATQSDVCFTCHKEQRAQMNRPSHHPLAEGKMSCADCHNVHGSAGPKLVKRDSTNDTCYTCHAEKRGPFVQSHEPVNDDCATCHNPHGSSVAGMLKARAPILCQQCHTPHVAGAVGAVGGQSGVFPPAVSGQGTSEVNSTSSGLNTVNIWQGRSCLNCHTQVHGTNNPTPQRMFR